MPTRTVIDDYVMAAMARARHSWAENGTLVLTVPDFPGIVACGADVPRAMGELYRLLEAWVQLSQQRGYSLPKIWTEQGEIDVNSGTGGTVLDSRTTPDVSEGNRDDIFIGGPDEMESYIYGFRQEDQQTR